MAAWRVGVDIGGTFTDVALVEEGSGRVAVAKVLTTPHDFAEGVLEGLRQGLSERGVAPDAVTLLSHATTVVTNALLERKGAKAAFVSNRGFRDILELRRSARADLYDLFQDGPSVLIPRRRRFEITGRIDASGEEVTPLAEEEMPALVEAIRASGAETVGVSLLFSFLNDSHERRLGAILREALPGVRVFLSSEVLPEIREYERASTTAVCACVGPLLAGYLARLQEATRDLGLPRLHVMGSSGGVLDVPECLRMPAAVVESGPAAGVVAAALIGRQLGMPNILSFDMGGTTAKASVIAGGEVTVTAEYEVGGAGNAKRWIAGTGHPIRVPVVDLAEVSSGGGSIAWVDPGGALKVGPHSAGAVPGPAAYGRGGARPTVTDADIVLGYLDALLDGRLAIDRAAAERAIAEHVASPLGLTVEQAAARIVEVVNASMCDALRIVSIERGHDPREFGLMAFGGAGPVHAAFLAEELGVPEVVVPPAPGAFSALGLVATDLRRDFSRTLFMPLEGADPARVAAVMRTMEADGLAMLEAAGVPPGRRALQRLADCRYRRQAYELTVPVQDGPVTRETLRTLSAAFHAKHRQTYGHANEREPVQLVNLRVTALGRQPALTLSQPTGGGGAREGREGRERTAIFGGVPRKTRVLWREGLAPGAAVAGPAVIEALDSTTVVPPGWTARVAEHGLLRITRGS
jgi:N-methylhydantoinase A